MQPCVIMLLRTLQHFVRRGSRRAAADVGDAQVAGVDEADELGRLVIEQRVRAHRVGRRRPGVAGSAARRGRASLSVARRVAAVAVEQPSRTVSLSCRSCDALVAVDAARSSCAAASSAVWLREVDRRRSPGGIGNGDRRGRRGGGDRAGPGDGLATSGAPAGDEPAHRRRRDPDGRRERIAAGLRTCAWDRDDLPVQRAVYSARRPCAGTGRWPTQSIQRLAAWRQRRRSMPMAARSPQYVSATSRNACRRAARRGRRSCCRGPGSPRPGSAPTTPATKMTLLFRAAAGTRRPTLRSAPMSRSMSPSGTRTVSSTFGLVEPEEVDVVDQLAASASGRRRRRR